MFDPFEQGARGTGVGRSYVPISQATLGDAAGAFHGGFGHGFAGGTVIPHHRPGRGGGSLGYNPHKPPHKNVVIDPQVGGRSITLDLARINGEACASAYAAGMEFANEVMDGEPEQIDGIKMRPEEGPRLGVYAAARMLADTCGLSTGPTAPRAWPTIDAGASRPPAQDFAATIVPTPTNPQVNFMPAASPVSSPPAARPLSRFQPAQSAPAAPAAPAAAVAPRPAAAPSGGANPPTRKVTLDFGDPMGQLVAHYHDVVRSGGDTSPGGLILVWDTRWAYGEPYFPEHLQKQFAVQVDGSAEAHLVMAMGGTFTFEHNGFRYCPLGIVESMPA